MRKTKSSVMKKTKISVRPKYMKRTIAAALAVMLAASVALTSAVSQTEAAENADTLMGIEKLRNQYAEGREYVILEVVPDKSAAEIGYLFDGFEPLLSKWDAEKQEWISWKSQLIDIDPDKRAQFIADKTRALKDYYTAIGIDLKDKDKMPVVFPGDNENYEESPTPQEGFEEIKADDYEAKGYFALADSGTGKYQLSFNPERNKKNGEAYYLPARETEIMKDTYQSIADDMPVYTRYWDGNDLVYEYVGLMSECREKIEASFDNPDIVTGQGTNDHKKEEDETGDDKAGDDDDETDDSEENDTNVGDEGEKAGDGEENDGNVGGEGEKPGEGEENDGNVGGEGEKPGDSEGNGSNVDGEGEKTGDSKENDNKAGVNENSDNKTQDDASENNQENTSAKAGARTYYALQGKWTKLVNLTASEDGSSDPAANDDENSNNNGGTTSDGTGNGSDGNGNNSGSADDGSGNDGTGSGNTGDGSGNDGTGSGSTDDGSGNDGTGSGNTGDGSDSENGNESGNGDDGTGESEDIDSKDGEDKDDEDGKDKNDEDIDDKDKDGKDKDDDDKAPKTDGKKKPNDGAKAVSSTTEKYYLVDFERMTTAYYEENTPRYFYSVGEIIASQSGQYSFIEDDSSVDTQTYTLPDKVIYCKGVFRNNEWFKHYVLNMSADNYENFKVKVITLTPDELNEMYQNNEVPKFNFLYLNSGLRSYVDNTGGNGEDSGNTDTDQNPGTGEGGNGDTDPNSGTGEGGNEDNTSDTDDNNNGRNDNSDTSGNNNDQGDNTNTADASEWVAYVSITDPFLLTDSDNIDEKDSGDNSNNENTTDDTDNPDNKDTTDGADASDNKDTTDGADASDNKDTTDDTDNPDNKDATDDTDNPDNKDTTDDTDNPNDKDVADDTESEDDTDVSDDEEDTGDKKAPGRVDSSDVKKAAVDGITVYAEGNSPLTNDVINYLYKETAAKALPCLVDGAILYEINESGVITLKQSSGNAAGDPNNGTGGDTNQNPGLFRLALMMCQENLETDVTGVSITNLLKGIVEDADGNFTTDQVYCRFGNGNDSIVNSDFFAHTFYRENNDEQAEVSEGFQKVLDEIKLENLYRESDTSGSFKPLSTNIGQAQALRHILNYAERRSVETKKEIKVLEIQPAKMDKPQITLEQVRKWASDEVEKVDVTLMTTAEFIGKIEKLNENYDLIYIGTGADHLNIRYWYPDSGYSGKPDANHAPAGTAFNDSDMDGLIYYNIGDLRATSMALAGQLDTEYWDRNRNERVYYYNYVRYGGNDITEEKERALLSFLNGSYPVIISDEFLEQPATVFIDTDYKGARVNLSEGQYTLTDLQKMGIRNDDISSIKVKDGYRITVYQDDNYVGYQASYEKDVPNLVSENQGRNNNGNWNDDISSLIIERVEDKMPTRNIDGDHIDNCTYLYDFVSKVMKENYLNFYAWSDIDETGSELFKFYLNRPKVSVTPTYVNGRTEEGSDIHYIQTGVNGRYGLEYHFIIRNEGAASVNTRYQCKLYIDVNSDGKYSEREEIADISLTQGGNAVSQNALYADREYVLTREVPDGYKGLLPWKVEITQVDNDNIYASMNGYTKLEGMDKEVLNILQIGRAQLPDVGWQNGMNEKLFDLGEQIETEGKDYHALVYGGVASDGVYYEGISDEFDINVTFKTIPQYEEEYKQNSDYLKDFNMLILGFSDIYGDFDGDPQDVKSPMGGIVNFLNSGKSVLFAHDTTSSFNFPKEPGNSYQNGRAYPSRGNHELTQGNGDYHNASSLNRAIRNLVGMDRYGILNSNLLKAGNPLYEGSDAYNQVVSSGKDVAYKPKSNKKETVPQVQGYTYFVISAKDMNADNNGGSGEKRTFDKQELDLSQADNWSFTNTYRNIRYDQVFYEDWSSDYGEVVSPYNGQVTHMYVTQVNQGQITEYPYKLKDTFEVAMTHAQWYELDYTADDDGDGQSDLVVWYCLGPRNNGTQETLYSQSPNDVRNNYYIYNKGNITYTGVGHGVNTNPAYTVDEAKLFINTMIASYQAGVKPPTITALENGSADAAQLTTLYRHYDDVNMLSLSDAALAEGYEKVYFTVRDVNFVKGTREIAARAYYKDDGGSQEITVDGVNIRVNPLNYGMYNAVNDSPVASADNLTSGGIYYILVPKSVMNKADEAGGLDIYFEAWSIIQTDTTTVNTYETDKVYAKVNVLKTFLFNLD